MISAKKGNDGKYLSNTVPIFDKSENTKSIVRQLIKDHLKLDLAETDISIAHRLGPSKGKNKPAKHQEDRRSIIFRLCRKDLVGAIFSHCKKSPPPFFINESLTPLRNKICYSLRALKKSHPTVINKVRTYNGIPRVFVNSKTRQKSQSQGENLKRFEIPTVLDLENFAASQLNTTLQEEGISFKDRV